MRRVIILGAAGRDFHDFNVLFRNDPAYEVVAFTATQIPDIAGRRYPPELAGPLYPGGIPILDEKEMENIIREKRVDVVVFAYSDVSNQAVMQLAARALAAGADYWLLGPGHTMLRARVPVVSICAVRTGCGKSPVSRAVAAGAKVTMPVADMFWGDRYGKLEDPFGHHWSVATHTRDVSPEEMQQAVQKMGG